MDAVGHLLEEGRFRLYCCDSTSGESWLARDVPAARKSEVQAAFDSYLVQELVPFLRHEANDPLARFIVTGASLGAYNAVNAHARHPDLFWLSLAMSGTYDFDRWMDGHVDETYVAHQPFRFVPLIPEGPQVEWLRRGFFHIASGRGRWEAPLESVKLGRILGERGFPTTWICGERRWSMTGPPGARCCRCCWRRERGKTGRSQGPVVHHP